MEVTAHNKQLAAGLDDAGFVCFIVFRYCSLFMSCSIYKRFGSIDVLNFSLIPNACD